MNIQDKLRALPSVDKLLESKSLEPWITRYSRDFVVQILRSLLDGYRQDILQGIDLDKDVLKVIENTFKQLDLKKSQPILNATGILLHTNLGRSLLDPFIAAHVQTTASSYSNLEYNLQLGKRGYRTSFIEFLLSMLTGAQDAFIVNNNAAATLLCLRSMAANREVVLSRGELVEIGGSFRIPEIFKESGAILREIGTTNKTKITDYSQAINEQTALLLKVHTSNYSIVGFSEEASLKELSDLSKKSNLPFVYDLGSGLLDELSSIESDEPTVRSSLKEGADVVLFSGDKLFGGPQCGIILGKKEYIEPMKKHPLARVLRPGKMTLVALEQTILEYFKKQPKIPTLQMLSKTIDQLKIDANRLKTEIENSSKFKAEIIEVNEKIGGGTTPLLNLKGIAISLSHQKFSAVSIEKKLRAWRKPIIVRIHEDQLLIHMRTLQKGDIQEIITAIGAFNE